jgi:hypothetical protein
MTHWRRGFNADVPIAEALSSIAGIPELGYSQIAARRRLSVTRQDARHGKSER